MRHNVKKPASGHIRLAHESVESVHKRVKSCVVAYFYLPVLPRQDMASSILETLGHRMDEDDDDVLDDIDLPNSSKLLDEEGAGETDYQHNSIVNIPGHSSDAQEYSYDDFEDFETSTSDVENRKGSTRGAVESESQLDAKRDIDRPNEEDSQGRPPRIPSKSSKKNDGEAYETEHYGPNDRSAIDSIEFNGENDNVNDYIGSRGVNSPNSNNSFFPEINVGSPNSAVKLSEMRRAARSAPSSDQIPNYDTATPNSGAYVNHSGITPNSKGSIDSSIGNPFALEFERAKTKVLSREVKKMRKAILNEHAPWSPGNKETRGAGANTPVQLTPEAERRSRLVTEAREQLAGHKSKFQKRITDRSQRLYDWSDPDWIEKKTDIEATMLIEKYAMARAKVNAMQNKTFEREFMRSDGKLYVRQQKRKRRKRLNEQMKKK